MNICKKKKNKYKTVENLTYRKSKLNDCMVEKVQNKDESKKKKWFDD